MKIVRLPLQILALLLQTYFIVETVRLFVDSYILHPGESSEEGWFAMLFTLLIVIACEVISIFDVIIFVITEFGVYSIIYLVLMIANAYCFMNLAYYSAAGTIISMTLYAILYILRIINLVHNSADLLKKLRFFCNKTPQKKEL